jgi:hypothetical protein
MNYDLTLEGSKEFYPNLSNKTYYISVIIGDDKIKYMNNMFDLFINNKEIIYIGIDFEFNKVSRTDRDVALMQINLEDNTNKGYIFILDPKIINHKNKLIELITKKSAIKILHGSESLDIPYLFNKLLITKNNIDLFCNNFYDTKYICDYDNKNTKCGIYNILLSSKIITKNKFDELEKMSDDIGPLYNIYINIKNLLNTTKKNYNIFIYSLYDVLYLPELIKKYIFNGDIYKYIIPEITAIVFKYKRNIIPEGRNNFEDLQKLINNYDNKTILIDNEKVKKVKLVELWEIIYYCISDNNYYFYNLKNIDYFKKFIVVITKLILYNNLLQNNIFNKYFIWLKKYKYFYEIIDSYNNNIKKI